MSGAVWLGPRLFLGCTVIGKIEREKEHGWFAMSYLPGAPHVIGRNIESEAKAKELVMKSAQSRCEAMFGATMDTVLNAVHEGRKLRTVARAIWRAGVWQCDRAVNARIMFEDLGRALGLEPVDGPQPTRNTDETSGATGSKVRDIFDPVEEDCESDCDQPNLSGPI
ncbi:hypothetical protein [Tritonibacter mobilis]|uniref:Uncharacterized protein n=1 Tax=Tritonibacter mobilis F1926 TaxID=1265309 RepID=A0A1B1A8N4_9RHOB|nr:hypothetical protein [Tritonibacter mobilis]ANP42934.1 hypothetical protein K529_019410 [Tritonibacter mobilis F1926]KJZ23254.1 hypothetical protein TW79_13195 [Tritonibacter mobilis]